MAKNFKFSKCYGYRTGGFGGGLVRREILTRRRGLKTRQISRSRCR
jgi:hypothetical protein